MKIIRNAWFAFMIAVFGVTAITLFAPYIPVDETRYLSVAWEMRLNHSFVVPLLNGLPYSNKPPLLFWLINLDISYGRRPET